MVDWGAILLIVAFLGIFVLYGFFLLVASVIAHIFTSIFE